MTTVQLSRLMLLASYAEQVLHLVDVGLLDPDRVLAQAVGDTVAGRTIVHLHAHTGYRSNAVVVPVTLPELADAVARRPGAADLCGFCGKYTARVNGHLPGMLPYTPHLTWSAAVSDFLHDTAGPDDAPGGDPGRPQRREGLRRVLVAVGEVLGPVPAADPPAEAPPAGLVDAVAGRLVDLRRALAAVPVRDTAPVGPQCWVRFDRVPLRAEPPGERAGLAALGAATSTVEWLPGAQGFLARMPLAVADRLAATRPNVAPLTADPDATLEEVRTVLDLGGDPAGGPGFDVLLTALRAAEHAPVAPARAFARAG